MVFQPLMPPDGIMSDYFHGLFWRSCPHSTFPEVSTRGVRYPLGCAVKLQCHDGHRGFRVGVLRAISIDNDGHPVYVATDDIIK